MSTNEAGGTIAGSTDGLWLACVAPDAGTVASNNGSAPRATFVGPGSVDTLPKARCGRWGSGARWASSMAMARRRAATLLRGAAPRTAGAWVSAAQRHTAHTAIVWPRVAVARMHWLSFTYNECRARTQLHDLIEKLLSKTGS